MFAEPEAAQMFDSSLKLHLAGYPELLRDMEEVKALLNALPEGQ